MLFHFKFIEIGLGASQFQIQTIFTFGTLIVFASLFFSHGFSFYSNFIGKKEYEKTTIRKISREPYERMRIMHLAIILCFFAASISLGKEVALTPAIAIFIIIIKTTIDAFAHLKEHKEISQY